MKIIHYQQDEVLLTNNEFSIAKVLWLGEKVYFCERLDDLLTHKFVYTKNQFLSDRFKYLFVVDEENLQAGAFLYDKDNTVMYALQDGMKREKAINNLIDRENGKDAPLWHSPMGKTKERILEMVPKMLTEDEFIEKGGRNKYKMVRYEN